MLHVPCKARVDPASSQCQADLPHGAPQQLLQSGRQAIFYLYRPRALIIQTRSYSRILQVHILQVQAALGRRFVEPSYTLRRRMDSSPAYSETARVLQVSNSRVKIQTCDLDSLILGCLWSDDRRWFKRVLAQADSHPSNLESCSSRMRGWSRYWHYHPPPR